ncbi:cytochrome c3 family protein [Paucibacter sp. JuS9]|uniref:cytochrome c3 family protein n=1 Tax=Paucibacter sp. JuS9 TaxID=3228748 RepID=UPI0037578983
MKLIHWMLGLVLWLTQALAGAATSEFDHLRTGFALTGSHQNQRCESCHIGGVFKGTPRDCDSCHTSGARFAKTNTVKPASHIPTSQSCDSCHNTRSFTGAKMNHSGVGSGSCASCHNGAIASGKTSDHVQTSLSCDSCHRTSAWKPLSAFNHAGVAPGTCVSCHNGSKATGKPANHTPYTGVASLASLACDSCHKAGFTSWTPAKLHASVAVTEGCASCHAALKPANAVHAGQTACESCHKSTSSWGGAKVDHASFNASTNCASCHNGSSATGKPSQHMPTGSANCSSCHSTGSWKPSKWNHTQLPVSNQCASCHSGAFPPADGKPAAHTPYTAVASLAALNCDSCHKAGFTAWAPARLHASVAVSEGCASCHAASKPNTAIHAGQTVCESCHKSTSSWTGAKVDHGSFNASTNCTSCHNGSSATAKSASHVPVASTNCISCHTTSSWKPTKWNHTQLSVTNQCASCHTGAFPPADGKPASHTPYQLVPALAASNCDSCHKSGFTAWAPAKLHSSVAVTSNCSTCHLSVRPTNATHSGQTVCESCHKSTSSWSGAKVDHSTFNAATNCASCHNGSSATAKSASHIPVGSTNCISCHSTSSWKPSKWNHTQLPVTSQCASCHSGAYLPADGKPATHTPYQLVSTLAAANCDSCHKAGFTAWAPARLHASVTVSTSCSTCHLSARPGNATHAGQTVCESCHKSTSSWTGAKVDHSGFTVATNCASCHNGSSATGKPAVHIPVAATNCISCHTTSSWKPTKWNHTQLPVTSQCASCHSGAYPPADGKPATHTPYQLVGTIAASNCDTCHKAGYASWTPARLHASVTVTNSCSTCHLSARPATTIHAGQTVCENCHKSTSSWTGAKVDHSGFTVATNCASCHNGSSATGKPAVHMPVGTTNCISCHTTASWKPTKWNHTQLPVTSQCASCHSGAYPPADGKPASHTPYQLVGTIAASNCDTCHKAGYASWTPARLHASVTVTNSCSTCHLSARPATTIHAGQTVCENCHKSTSTWTGAKVDHSGFTVATNCASCHNGSTATGKAASHMPVGTTNCISCHTTSAWKPSKWNHTQLPVTSQCASCHSGAYPPADGKPATHTPYQLVGTIAASNCDTCHKAGYASWTPARLHASVTVTNSCSTCHLSARPATTIHAGQTVCENCHKSTSTWTGAKVDHSGFTVATNCASCHNGSTATGKAASHMPVGTTNCISCHTTSAWKPTKWNHTQVTVVNQCGSCHSGAYPPADAKPANHIPYQLLTGVAITNCDTCHKTGFASWAGGRFHANVTVTGQCKTCHNGSYTSQGATAKPANHIPENQLLNGAAMECSACHTSVTAWTQKMNHNASMGSGAGWCKSCHASGTAYLGGMERKSLTHRTKTPVPTDCSESGCHRPLGNKGAAYTKWD